MKLLKRTLPVGWVLLFLDGFLVVEFPNASWNHSASLALWWLSIIVLLATLGFCVLVAVRLVSRLVKGLEAQPAGREQPPTAQSRGKWSHMLAVGSVAILAIAVFVGTFLVVIEHQIKSSPVYHVSVAQAQESPKVVEALGQPVAAGWLVLGQLTESTNGVGHAELTIPLVGPKGRSKLLVEASRQAGVWRLSTLRFVSAGYNPATDILAEGSK